MSATDSETEADVLRYHIAWLIASTSSSDNLLGLLLWKRALAAEGDSQTGSGEAGGHGAGKGHTSARQPVGKVPAARKKGMGGHHRRPIALSPPAGSFETQDNRAIDPRLFASNVAGTSAQQQRVIASAHGEGTEPSGGADADALGELAREVIALGPHGLAQDQARCDPLEHKKQGKKRKASDREGKGDVASKVAGLPDPSQGLIGKEDDKRRKEIRVKKEKHNAIEAWRRSTSISNQDPPPLQDPATTVPAQQAQLLPDADPYSRGQSSEASGPVPAPGTRHPKHSEPAGVSIKQKKSVLPAHLATNSSDLFTPSKMDQLPAGMEPDELSTPMQPILFGRAAHAKQVASSTPITTGKRAAAGSGGRVRTAGVGWVVNTPT